MPTPVVAQLFPARSTVSQLVQTIALTVSASIIVTNQTITFTGSTAGGTTMTVSAIAANGALAPGQTVTLGTFTGTIVSQLTGTTGSTGTYQLSGSSTVSSTTGTAYGDDQFCISIDPTNAGDAAQQYIYGSYGSTNGEYIAANETFIATIGCPLPAGAVVRCWSKNGTCSFSFWGMSP